MAQLALNYIDGNTEKEYELINKIVEMLAQEASIDKKIAEDQYIYAFYGDLKDELDYIYNHMSERLTLRDISNQLYISKSNLSSQFHTLMGMGFKKYVDTLKISKSIEMLLTTNKTISQISDALGFSNASTYSKLFKNYLSVTPNEYRTMKNMINIMVVQMKRCQKTKRPLKNSSVQLYLTMFQIYMMKLELIIHKL